MQNETWALRSSDSSFTESDILLSSFWEEHPEDGDSFTKWKIKRRKGNEQINSKERSSSCTLRKQIHEGEKGLKIIHKKNRCAYNICYTFYNPEKNDNNISVGNEETRRRLFASAPDAHRDVTEEQHLPWLKVDYDEDAVKHTIYIIFIMWRNRSRRHWALTHIWRLNAGQANALQQGLFFEHFLPVIRWNTSIKR